MDRQFLERPRPAAALAVLILLSTVAFSVETLPEISDGIRSALWWFEVFVVAVFSAEYLYRIACAQRRLGFVLSFYGLVDLAAILPFYLGLAVDLRSLRVLRLLRLLRLLKLARYNAAISRLGAALMTSKDELVVSVAVLLIALFVAALGIYQFEHAAQPDKFRSIFDALWWSVATISTVGYGDVIPVTIGGRIFTFAVLIVSLGLISIPTGIFATALLAIRRKEEGRGQRSDFE